MTHDRHQLVNFHDDLRSPGVCIPNGTNVPICSVGRVNLNDRLALDHVHTYQRGT
ncbi:hypothetical protein LINPERPRIM_LOCUS31638 [Linum perenne]